MIKYFSIFLIMACFLNNHLQAQENRKAYFLSGGLFYLMDIDQPIQANLSGYYQHNFHLFSLQSNVGSTGNGSDDGAYVFSLMYGRVTHGRWIKTYATIGPAYYFGEWEQNKLDRYKGIGLSAEGAMIFTPIKYFGIGLKLSGTLRKHATFPLVLLTAEIGKLTP